MPVPSEYRPEHTPTGVGRRRVAPHGVGLLLLLVLGALVVAQVVPVGAEARALERQIGGLGPWGPLAFGLFYVVAVLLMVPASALTLAAGALFGPVIGTITVSLASTLGAALAFLIARSLAREQMAEWVRSDPRLAALDRALHKHGWRLAALLRLSPIVPFNLQNYLYGLTGIPFRTCMLTSWVTMLPGTILYVCLGHAGRHGLDSARGVGRPGGALEWAGLVTGLVTTGVVAAHASRLARDALREVPARGPSARATGRDRSRRALRWDADHDAGSAEARTPAGRATVPATPHHGGGEPPHPGLGVDA